MDPTLQDQSPYQNQQSWPPHLLQPVHQQQHSPYPSPTTSIPNHSFADSPYYHQGPPPSSAGSLPRSSSGLSLNMSSLSVASTPGSVPSTAGALSPVTPLSPTNITPQQGGFAQQAMQQHNTFRFAPPDIVHYEQQGPSPYEPVGGRRPPGSSRSSSSSEKSVPRKRSLTTSSMPLSVSVEEDVNFDSTELHTPGSLDDSDMCYGIESSPIDGSPSSGEHADEFRIIESHLGPPGSGSIHAGAAFSVLGKTSGTNNFVSKLYQMINDSKSAHFISWTELGTSFMVSNVGEFSRSILGSHFKHNNFSSFVRQLNMYGFHKINRTPRAQRTSTDAQTWEFSHPKFLRGRTDLLDDIKRKSLEQDLASVKQRIELPAEVALQLNRMSEDHRRAVKAITVERQKVERLTGVVKVMYDMMASAFPGQIPMQFPAELLDSSENPPILITSHSHSQPTSQQQSQSQPQSQAQHRHSPSNSAHPSRFNATLSSTGLPVHASISPSSSPTASDFPHHYHQPHSHPPAPLHSHYDPDPHPPHTPSPDNSNSMPGGEHGPSPKRQRTGAVAQPHHERKLSRARSDSAPLGYGFGHVHPHAHHPYATPAAAPGHGPNAAHLGRPRSGSNLAGRREDGFLSATVSARMSSASVGVSSFAVPGMTIKDEPSHHPS
ncbi:hypothetical protein K439DRAFT_739685 [Ramaria rubella]|nr:hypothetical protein K439DRAFT_739685 [Ramaria rubella]